MGAYLFRRLLTLVPVWIGITLLAFLLIHSIPGGPFDNGTLRSKAATDFLLRFYHLDEPLWRQYLLYLQNVVHGDLGESMVRRGLYVSDLLRERFPISLMLGGAGLFVSLAVGIPAGLLGAVKQNTWVDHSVIVAATVGYAIPNFVLSLLLIIVFGGWLGWFPLGGWGGISHLVLPAIALGLPWAGLIARLTRSSMLEVLRQDYVRVAIAKGAPPRRVVLRHAFRNATIPLTAVIAVLAAELVTGSLVVEIIFGIPGIGRYMIDSVLGSDYTLTLGLTVFYATLIFVANFVADLSYALLDPRIRVG
jgi:ABC-type dipeptide/oligopeptide/nickel transport system permease component